MRHTVRASRIWLISGSIMLSAWLLMSMAGLARAELLQDQAKQRFLERLERTYQETRTILADFREVRKLKHLQKPLVFRGRMGIDLEQDFLFLDYRRPSQHIVRVQNGTVLFYVRGQSTADRFDLAATPGAPPSGGLLSWSPRDFQGQVRAGKSSYQLTPELPDGAARQLRVSLDKESLILKSMLIQEPSGESTRLNFDNMILNKPLPRDMTEFSLPEGTTVQRIQTP
jgi:hypothetical protein